MPQNDEFSCPLIPLKHAKDFVANLARAAVLSAAARENMPYFRIQGQLESSERGLRLLRCPDSGESLSLGMDSKLSACEDGAFIEVEGRPFVSSSQKSSALFINVEVEDWRYVDGPAEEKGRSAVSLDFIRQVLRERSTEGRALQSRRFPAQLSTISVIVSKFGGNTALKDILGDFRKDDYELQVQYIAISSPKEICAAIARARGQVLVIARGGGPDESLEAFNNIQVLRALNETDKYRILGLGHATDVTLADFFADTRAQSPTAAGTALKRLLAESREKHRMKKQLEEAGSEKRGLSPGTALGLLTAGLAGGMILSRFL